MASQLDSARADAIVARTALEQENLSVRIQERKEQNNLLSGKAGKPQATRVHACNAGDADAETPSLRQELNAAQTTIDQMRGQLEALQEIVSSDRSPSSCRSGESCRLRELKLEMEEGSIQREHLRRENESLTRKLNEVEFMCDQLCNCLLYTSDAADEEDSGDLGGGRVI
eukprot:TRINITY_DN33829_c0_g1_i1.p1 TRINITY_DN33829_c0_g1~~TRINITY_DN33829_c0_g1_i1.p1  ORF type:complete len:171 (+),score=45.49 TRINITY_DN33829_c0_g1_i1:164-676(+)